MEQLRAEAAVAAVAPVVAWAGVRRLREPIAWTLLALTAVGVLIGAWELFGLRGSPRIAVPVAVSAPTSATPGGAAGAITGIRAATTFAIRASAVAPDFVAPDLFALPVVAVVLVAFAGGVTVRARQVVETAIGIQAVTLGLGLVCWIAALGQHLHDNIWFVADASELAIVATALTFTVAVRQSRPLRPLLASPDDHDTYDDSSEDDFEALGHEVEGSALENSLDDFEGFGDKPA